MPFEPIAIVGQACVLPGALSPDEFWQLLAYGTDAVRRAPRGYWGLDSQRVVSKSAGTSRDKCYSDRGGYVYGFENIFDIERYDLDPATAEALMSHDPLTRWLLQCAAEALAPVRLKDVDSTRQGLIVGNLCYPTSKFAEFAECVWLREAGLYEKIPPSAHSRFVGGSAALVAGALGLEGTAYCLDAACASSLYAIKLACDALHDRRADVMLAGGMNRADDLFIHIGFTALGALSRSGRSRPFHRGADGLIPAEGCALVALKRLDDAVQAGDRIFGVIRGVGLSNDGTTGGFLSPSPEGQLRAIASAYEQAEIDPRNVSYVECHATGTAIGDGVELEGLRSFFSGAKELKIGSHKSNLGHLITAAGAAGLLKVLGSFAHDMLPPTIHLDDMRPEAAQAPLRVISRREAWPRGERPRIAAVSAFGLGGTNAHLIVEEWQGAPAKRGASPQPAPAKSLADDASQPTPKLSRVALVGMSVITGQPLDQIYLNAAPGKSRFAPHDLELSLPQQLLAWQVVEQAVEGLTLPPAATAVLVGMECDAEIARYGARWRTPQWAHDGRFGKISDPTAAALQDRFVPPLEAGAVTGTMPNIPANRLNVQFDWRGPSFTVSADELSGVRALEIAARLLTDGTVEAAVACAVDLSCETVHATALKQIGIKNPQLADSAVALVLKSEATSQRDGDQVLAWLTLGSDETSPVDVSDAANEVAGFAAQGLLMVARKCEELLSQPQLGRSVVECSSLHGQLASVIVEPGHGTMPEPRTSTSKLVPFPAHWKPIVLEGLVPGVKAPTQPSPGDTPTPATTASTVSATTPVAPTPEPSRVIEPVKPTVTVVAKEAVVAPKAQMQDHDAQRVIEKDTTKLLPTVASSEMQKTSSVKLQVTTSGATQTLRAAPRRPSVLAWWDRSNSSTAPRPSLVTLTVESAVAAPVWEQPKLNEQPATFETSNDQSVWIEPTEYVAQTSDETDSIEATHEFPPHTGQPLLPLAAVHQQFMAFQTAVHQQFLAQRAQIAQLLAGGELAAEAGVEPTSLTAPVFGSNIAHFEFATDISQIDETPYASDSDFIAPDSEFGFTDVPEPFVEQPIQAAAPQVPAVQPPRVSAVPMPIKTPAPSNEKEGGNQESLPHAPIKAPAPAAPTHKQSPHTKDPRRTPIGPAFGREELKVLGSGKISEVFGPLFERQDAYRRQVRLPMPPLLLCDRVCGIDAEPGVLGRGTIWTETDITWDSWYLHDGVMPAGIMIESGQADLTLISWMGADFLNQDERVYRLLGCEATFFGSLPKPGETLHYQIQIDGHARQGGVRLFFFHYDCYVGDELRLRVRNGQAGFFTDDELDHSDGVIWDAATGERVPQPRLDAPAVVTNARSFSAQQISAFFAGRLKECFGPAFFYSDTHVRTPRIGSEQLRFFDEVLEFEAPQANAAPNSSADADSGRRGWGGYLKARKIIHADDWYFPGHFFNDPCMPGTLMFEGCLQTMAFYLTALGYTLDRDGWRFEPVAAQSYLMRCRGQVTPKSRELIFEVFVEEVFDGPEPTVFADLLCSVDGVKAFHCRRMGLQLNPDWPLSSLAPTLIEQPGLERLASDKPGTLARLTDRSEESAEIGRTYLAQQPAPRSLDDVVWVDDVRGDYPALMACAWGRPSNAFGSMYSMFDGARRAPRLPGPPYHFMSRILRMDAQRGVAKAGFSVLVEYDVPPNAWYFSEHGTPTMPFSVLQEICLQPCGWLATLTGITTRAKEDLFFRNLDGKATVFAEVLPTSGTIRVTAKLTRCSTVGDTSIVFFAVEAFIGEQRLAVVTTSFGFFTKAALSQQVGVGATDAERAMLTDAAPTDPTTSATIARLLKGDSGQRPGLRLPNNMLRLFDRITGWWPKGGKAGLGRIRSEQDVDPAAWYFKAHFYSDAVQAGSLGVQGMLNLLQAAMQLAHLDQGLKNPRFEAIALNEESVWTYRGQVGPKNKQVSLTIDVLDVQRGDLSVTAMAEARLWCDGLCIYFISRIGMRVIGDGREEIRGDVVAKPIAASQPPVITRVEPQVVKAVVTPVAPPKVEPVKPVSVQPMAPQAFTPPQPAPVPPKTSVPTLQPAVTTHTPATPTQPVVTKVAASVVPAKPLHQPEMSLASSTPPAVAAITPVSSIAPTESSSTPTGSVVENETAQPKVSSLRSRMMARNSTPILVKGIDPTTRLGARDATVEKPQTVYATADRVLEALVAATQHSPTAAPSASTPPTNATSTAPETAAAQPESIVPTAAPDKSAESPIDLDDFDLSDVLDELEDLIDEAAAREADGEDDEFDDELDESLDDYEDDDFDDELDDESDELADSLEADTESAVQGTAPSTNAVVEDTEEIATLATEPEDDAFEEIEDLIEDDLSDERAEEAIRDSMRDEEFDRAHRHAGDDEDDLEAGLQDDDESEDLEASLTEDDEDHDDEHLVEDSTEEDEDSLSANVDEDNDDELDDIEDEADAELDHSVEDSVEEDSDAEEEAVLGEIAGGDVYAEEDLVATPPKPEEPKPIPTAFERPQPTPATLVALPSSDPNQRTVLRTFDPSVEVWINHHRPTFTAPTLPMMCMADMLANAARQHLVGTTRNALWTVIGIERLKAQTWLTCDRSRELEITTVLQPEDRDGSKVVAVTLKADRQPIASGHVLLAKSFPRCSSTLSRLLSPAKIRSPYLSNTEAGRADETPMVAHGPAFHLAKTVWLGATGANAELDAGAGAVPISLLHPALLDAALHAVPHGDLKRWAPAVPPGTTALPYELVKLELFGPTPRSGLIRSEVRIRNANVLKGLVSFGFELSTLDNNKMPQLWARFQLTEKLLPLGPFGRGTMRQMHDFAVDKKFVPGMSLSQRETDCSRLNLADVRLMAWLPGALESIYGITGPTQEIAVRIAGMEHIARAFEVHPSAIHFDPETNTGWLTDAPERRLRVALEATTSQIIVTDAIV